LGVGFRVQVPQFRDEGLKFGVWGLGFRKLCTGVSGLGFGVRGLRTRVMGRRFAVQG